MMLRPSRRSSHAMASLLVAPLLAFVGCSPKISAPPEPPVAVRLGDDSFAHEEYEEAVRDYRLYLDDVERGDYTARVFYKSALASYRLDDYPGTLATLDELSDRYPGGIWVQVAALRGDAERDLDRPVAALASWDQGLLVANDIDRPKLRQRMRAVINDLNTDDLRRAAPQLKSEEGRRIVLGEIGLREPPELGEPVPGEFGEEVEEEVEVLAEVEAAPEPTPEPYDGPPRNLIEAMRAIGTQRGAAGSPTTGTRGLHRGPNVHPAWRAGDAGSPAPDGPSARVVAISPGESAASEPERVVIGDSPEAREAPAEDASAGLALLGVEADDQEGDIQPESAAEIDEASAGSAARLVRLSALGEAPPADTIDVPVEGEGRIEALGAQTMDASEAEWAGRPTVARLVRVEPLATGVPEAARGKATVVGTVDYAGEAVAQPLDAGLGEREPSVATATREDDPADLAGAEEPMLQPAVQPAADDEAARADRLAALDALQKVDVPDIGEPVPDYEPKRGRLARDRRVSGLGLIDMTPLSGDVRVLCLLPLTGEDRSSGEHVLRGMRLAFGGDDPSVAYRDTGSRPEASAELLRNVVPGSSVVLVLAAGKHADAMALAGASRDVGVPVVALSDTPRAPRGLVWSIAPDAGLDGTEIVERLAADIVFTQPGARVALIYPDTDSERRWRPLLKGALVERGAILIGSVRYDPVDPTLTKREVGRLVREEGLQTIVFPDRIAAAAAFARSAQRKYPQLSVVGLQSMPGAGERRYRGIVFGEPGDSKVPRGFAESYEQKYGARPKADDSQAYDAASVAKAVLASGADTAERARRALRGVQGVAGATSSLSVTDNGIERGILRLNAD